MAFKKIDQVAYESVYKIELKNAKKEAVIVTVREPIKGN